MWKIRVAVHSVSILQDENAKSSHLMSILILIFEFAKQKISSSFWDKIVY